MGIQHLPSIFDDRAGMLFSKRAKPSIPAEKKAIKPPSIAGNYFLQAAGTRPPPNSTMQYQG
jgi:hypothetical protein